MHHSTRFSVPGVEAPTLLLILGCTVAWAALTALAASLGPWIAVPGVALCLVLHSSLQHEALHGHPTRHPWLNAALVFPALGLVIPYERFKAQHLAHHNDPTLTDPHDDPESNYLDPAAWARLPRPVKALLAANNTLLGRILLGPAIGMATFLAGEMRAALDGDRAVIRGWALHVPAVALAVGWLWGVGTMGWAAYAAAAYLALGILRIRTFLEHRAHARARARSVVIEDRGPLAFLFLNNNYHAVHHGHPTLPWYRLPAAYRAQRERYLEMNDGYRYGSYAEIFAAHALRAKDPVPHPLRPGA